MKRFFGRYTVTITHPEKPLLGLYTKADIVAYYERIAPYMVPYLKNRPLMMHRFPDGLEGESFYQKDAPTYFPDWIKKVRITKKDGFYNSVVCQNKATLVYLANQACITPHLWLSRIDKLSIPDRIIFDLDPSGTDFTPIRTIALAFKELLDTLGLTSFVMTSGSRGLHIYVPLRRSVNFTATKECARLCAQAIITQYPDLATLEMRKKKRGEKIFLDIFRNQQGSTAVAPYALRAKPNAPIATPLFWYEVEQETLHPQQYTIKNFFERLAQQPDPWKSFFQQRQTLTKPLHILKKIGALRAPEKTSISPKVHFLRKIFK